MAQTPIGVNDFFKYNGNLPYIGEKDTAGTMVVPSLQYILVGGIFVPVSAANPVPTSVGNLPGTQPVSGTVGVNALPALPAGTAIIGKTGIDPAANGVKNVDGTGTELFTVANPAQVKLQSSGATGSPAPTQAVEMGGKTPGGTLEALSLDANKNQKVVATNSAGNPVENTEGVLLASAARTTATNSPNQTNYNARGVLVTLTVTVASGLGGLIVKINTITPNSNVWVQLNPNVTAITTTGTYAYLVYPGATSTNGMQQTVNAPLPRAWVVQVAPGDATSYTYSVGYSLIV